MCLWKDRRAFLGLMTGTDLSSGLSTKWWHGSMWFSPFSDPAAAEGLSTSTQYTVKCDSSRTVNSPPAVADGSASQVW
jgi:hypothetical protein